MTSRALAIVLMIGIAGASVAEANAADPSRRFVYAAESGRLAYDVDSRGNRVPDFSHCGYGGGGVAIPDVPVRVSVAAREGDSTERIQSAIDHVSRLPADERGLRGAVLVKRGRHVVSGQLRINVGGVVLRGEGSGEDRTLLVADGTSRRTLIRVTGRDDRRLSTEVSHRVSDDYLPLGATRLRLENTSGLLPGSSIVITHPSTSAWIAALGMNRFPSGNVGSWLDWRAGTLDLQWHRRVVAVDGDQVTIDVPLTSALDKSLATSHVTKFDWPGRLRQVGIENLRCESTVDPSNPLDEEHAWGAIGFENVADAWVQNVEMRQFAGSAVSILESCEQITIQDCESKHPVSEIGGGRRHTFYTCGQRTLFHRCRSEQGRHDLAVGWLAAGPNAFVDCRVTDALRFSGPIESWASGVLFDNVDMDGGGLAVTNHETDGHGVGWAAANCVLWQCSAPVITCRQPPTASNWAIGCWGEFVGDGLWRSLNEFVTPESLYFAQLAERLGDEAVSRVKRQREWATSESLDEIDRLNATRSRELLPSATGPHRRLEIKNGWLTIDDQLATGGRLTPIWWRGQVLPARAAEFGSAVTRFVPGRDGPGFTDDLDQLTSAMAARGQTVVEHHWGLWYDRRRDDHEMIRRLDGNVWPPFYEQPWARSGRGRAWDGLSRFDLTRFNAWYFSRLKELADHCDRKGLVLIQQMYFQHNLLEAGAHWADFPWRPANCLQDTGFPEPPPYVGRKRIFLANEFYDVSHPVRRELHRAYIRHCLDVLGENSNVIFMTGEEFTGPLSFVQFWVDAIAEWQRESGRRVLVGLSATKDVQDAILADPQRAAVVKVIDLKYWWYADDGSLFAPQGGENLAPRQQWREWQGNKKRSPEQVARQVREYRARHPEKAVICSHDSSSSWSALVGGGSLPAVAGLDDDLRRFFPRLRLVEARDGSADETWHWQDPQGGYLAICRADGGIQFDLSRAKHVFLVRWIDVSTGTIKAADQTVSGGDSVELTAPAAGSWVVWLSPM